MDDPAPKLLLATGNAHKAREIRLVLSDLAAELLTFKDFPGIPAVEEDGGTLEENAAKKALSGARFSGLWTLADDTGLEVEALDGAPGVRSARYAGPDCDFEKNNRKLLLALEGVAARERRARFRCVMALAAPDGAVVTREGSLDGLIAERYAGGEGFGYDPIFFVPSLGRSLGELTLEEKCAVSHRFLALKAIEPDILRALGRAAMN